VTGVELVIPGTTVGTLDSEVEVGVVGAGVGALDTVDIGASVTGAEVDNVGAGVGAIGTRVGAVGTRVGSRVGRRVGLRVVRLGVPILFGSS